LVQLGRFDTVLYGDSISFFSLSENVLSFETLTQKQGWQKRDSWQRPIWETLSSSHVFCRHVPKLCTLHEAWGEVEEY